MIEANHLQTSLQLEADIVNLALIKCSTKLAMTYNLEVYLGILNTWFECRMLNLLS